MKEIEYVQDLCSRAKKASKVLKQLSSSKKNKILLSLADLLEKRKAEILLANELDLKDGKEKKLSSALMDRLLLNEKRIFSMASAVREIAALPDPIGEVTRGITLPNGLELVTRRVPLGVVMVIYESRPNVTIDVGALSFKSGNACILRGGSEAFYSNEILIKLFHEILIKEEIDIGSVVFVDKTDRSFMIPFFQQTSLIDIVVPRGGEGLIRFVSENSKIPVVKHDKGVCNLYIDQDADPEKVIPIVINSKVQRPGVCNSTENLILHNGYPFRKELLEALAKEGVELLLDPSSLALYPNGKPVKEQDYLEEFLDLRLSVKTISSLEEALAFIEKTSSGHTEAIVTEDLNTARIFTNSLDSAALFINCSTRFHDGGEFGLGAEVGISTGKLHVRGPMGLVHLTTTTTYVTGNGQIRG
ncbi:glutamate-5-semialdehyde dehydrogenase [Leptospira interrogans]|uniref:Gamma-glutamyl phosphate reductase n=1 Tax=Leptospira interrogans serovar Hardjo str. Norma TaxID=1279460 RepID=A0A0M4N6N4_LEPIR|nr:glutamate-5-semialdehyde dehydrogenase [Leptospira interrogans]ALE38227.1 gamma-glutamyl phosphate reductase [Leptospira interrogans serovar Hardjo str. Norma]ALN99570.1 gamma-glutamyl phosphate reductase [Leptospira interrogans serovar Hardjo-prajitno]EKO96804.1 glutamate-5-semialdehyde dehydrogenase [Leptospira interrogans str. Brem 329]MCD1165511.1 glutamate-5-semialdehyde dehydrogenase [Leptospira interrogans]MCH1885493.1 glutamate-5-semialdehyde dehydrogenase [Leptospira interrogans]